MEDIFIRTRYMFGSGNMEILKNAKIAVFGIGGVGSFAAEALCRSGIYNFTLFDNDIIEYSNINRQILALHSTLGRYKTETMKERMLDINPLANIITNNCFYTPESAKDYPLEDYDYIIDAIDTVTSKICLITKAKAARVSIISSMGTGNKINPCSLKVADIYDTSVCPLAKVIRKELKAKNIKSLKTVFSTEPPIKPKCDNKDDKPMIASNSFVPSVAGLIIASEVIKDLINLQNDN